MIKGGKRFDTTNAMHPIAICPTLAGEDAGVTRQQRKHPVFSSKSQTVNPRERNVKFDVRRCKSSFLCSSVMFCCVILFKKK